jgi:pantetheine-phosphate adenylyltransferase
MASKATATIRAATSRAETNRKRVMSIQRVGLYPGTFDPIHKGHYDIIHRAAKIVDQLVIGVAVNAGKGPLFSLEERVAMVQNEVKSIEERNISVRPFDNLLMHYAMSIGAALIVRGLRALSDFEYEFQMVGMNSRLNPDIETVFLMASDNHQFISSKLVKEIAMLGGDIRPFVSPRVADQLIARVAEVRRTGTTGE